MQQRLKSPQGKLGCPWIVFKRQPEIVHAGVYPLHTKGLPPSQLNSSIVPTALTTIFDLETTSKRNWALHVHDFLIQELKKAKQNNSAAIHGCVYVLMIIYFHETQFGENSKEAEARRPWIAYWKGDTLKKRLK
ncbi:hypothetical protein PIB30_004515 [Stylosanthes scabra]|uniref:Uncharacterized protein n=1 Tax=Stylosanthes scabra TaxID=79078 RepID=A0ABU6X5C3_9FABA|nr:hypothetical protein [Stylosanthes scabra]